MAGSAGSQSPDMQWVAVQGKPGQVNKTRAANELRDELMAGDWIKLHRKLTDSAVFTDSVLLHVWIFIITKANWKKRQLRNGTWIEAGELVTSRDRIAEVCKISPHQAYRRLKTLEKLQQIALKAHSRGTHVRVLNWDTYQHESEPSAQQAHNKRTTSAQQAHTEEEGKKGRTLFNSVLPEPKHTKNTPEKRSEYTNEFEQFWDVWPRRRRNNKRRAFKEWQRAKSRALVAEIMAGARAYAQSEKGRGDFCQMPSTWLHGDGWLDDTESLYDKSAPLPYKMPERSEADQKDSQLFREFADCRRQLSAVERDSTEFAVLQAKLSNLREQMQ